jgi:hypothetical protein
MEFAKIHGEPLRRLIIRIEVDSLDEFWNL